MWNRYLFNNLGIQERSIGLRFYFFIYFDDIFYYLFLQMVEESFAFHQSLFAEVELNC